MLSPDVELSFDELPWFSASFGDPFGALFSLLEFFEVFLPVGVSLDFCSGSLLSVSLLSDFVGSLVPFA